MYVCKRSPQPPVFPIEGFKAVRYSFATAPEAELNQKLVMVPVSTTATNVCYHYHHLSFCQVY
jgi:hypothetical protein